LSIELATFSYRRLALWSHGRDSLLLWLALAILLAVIAETRLLVLLRPELRLRRLRRGEAVVDWRKIVVIVLVYHLAELVALLILGLGRRNDAEIVLGVLQVVLGQYRIARRLGVTRKLQVFLGDVGGVAAHLYVGAV